jgi:hypothetical protein
MLTVALFAVAAAATATEPNPAATPPHIVRIVEAAALARLPDSTSIVLPVGSEIHARRYSYRLDAIVLDVHPIPPGTLFNDGFEARR